MLVVCVNGYWGRKSDGFIHPKMPSPPVKGNVYRVIRTRPSKKKWSSKIFHVLEEYGEPHGWEVGHFRPVNPKALDVFKKQKEVELA